MAPLVWLVTGATSGLGEALVSRIVAKGDKVVATGRRAEQRLANLRSDDVTVVDLDVSASRENVAAQVKKAWEAFGRIDVLVNNAGFSAPKAIEEASDQFMQDIFDVNVFGPIRVTQAILPHFRSRRRGGSVVFIGAGVAWAPIAFLAHYSAAKAALGRFAEGLRKELRACKEDMDIRCTVLEPGGFASRLGQPRTGSDEGFGAYRPMVPDYESLFAETMEVFNREIAPNIPGDVVRLADTIVDLVRAGEELPVRVVLGSDSLALVRQKCREQLELMDEFEHVSLRTDQDDAEAFHYEGMLRLTSMFS